MSKYENYSLESEERRSIVIPKYKKSEEHFFDSFEEATENADKLFVENGGSKSAKERTTEEIKVRVRRCRGEAPGLYRVVLSHRIKEGPESSGGKSRRRRRKGKKAKKTADNEVAS